LDSLATKSGIYKRSTRQERLLGRISACPRVISAIDYDPHATEHSKWEVLHVSLIEVCGCVAVVGYMCERGCLVRNYFGLTRTEHVFLLACWKEG